MLKSMLLGTGDLEEVQFATEIKKIRPLNIQESHFGYSEDSKTKKIKITKMLNTEMKSMAE